MLRLFSQGDVVGKGAGRGNRQAKCRRLFDEIAAVDATVTCRQFELFERGHVASRSCVAVWTSETGNQTYHRDQEWANQTGSRDGFLAKKRGPVKTGPFMYIKLANISESIF